MLSLGLISTSVDLNSERMMMASTDGEDEVQFLRTNVPADLSLCVFMLDRCVSVRALQEMLTNHEDPHAGSAETAGHRTLLYGQALLLRHTHSNMEDVAGHLRGGDCLRFLHGHTDECLTVSPTGHTQDERRTVHFEAGGVSSQAHSLWRIEMLRVWRLDELHHRANTPAMDLPIETLRLSLCDLSGYFRLPDERWSHESKQTSSRVLKNRQNLFEEEGVITLVLDCIDHLHLYSSAAHFAESAGKEAGDAWEAILNAFYELLAALIRGNENNCSHFSSSLDWLISRLEKLEASTGILEVLHCVLMESPEALSFIKEEHVHSIITLLHKHGRNHKILEVLCSLCVCHGTAVRSNQHLICNTLLPKRDLLLQSRLVNYVTSVRSNIYLCMGDDSSQYRKWYYEVVVERAKPFVTPEPTHLRVGWACSAGYHPSPTGGYGWGSNGVGDDLHSYGFDGLHLWTGGVGHRVSSANQHLLREEDVISCCLDLSAACISFRVNGQPVQGMLESFNTDALMFPVVSFSAGVRVRLLFGGQQGEFKYLPPAGFSPCAEALLPRGRCRLELCEEFTRGHRNGGRELLGPVASSDPVVYTPTPVDTNQVMLPPQLELIREKLAENLHELWLLEKSEHGWTHGLVRDDSKQVHPGLVEFSKLPDQEKHNKLQSAEHMLRSMLALGAHIGLSEEHAEVKVKYVQLSNKYELWNGYRPAPVDQSGVSLSAAQEALIEALAENEHNIWAREHIRQGWSYGPQQDIKEKRSPQLVPFSLLDERSRNCVKEPARDVLGTLLGFGYTVEPSEQQQYLGTDMKTASEQRFRIFRVEQTFAVNDGKWYFEFEAVTAGEMRVGWAQVGCQPDVELWSDEQAFVFDGSKGFSATVGFVPVCCLGVNQVGWLNLGQQVDTLKYFSVCGLQEGYQPFACNMSKDPPLWMSWRDPLFVQIPEDHPRIQVSYIDGTVSQAPALKVTQRAVGLNESPSTDVEFYRLSLPIECAHIFTKPKDGTVPSASSVTCHMKEPEEGEVDSDFEMLMKSAHKHTGSRDEFDSHKDHAQEKPSRLKQSEGKNIEPQCPPRVNVQSLIPMKWTRLPEHSPQVELTRLEERHGWKAQCTDSLQVMALHIPEEDRCIDILELSELKDLLKFFDHTLRLYSALCAHGNIPVSHALCSHIDQSQLLFALRCSRMPGNLRAGFYNLLMTAHLSAHSSARQATTHEYIVPMTDSMQTVTLFKNKTKQHCLPGSNTSTSLRPRMHFSSPCFVRASSNNSNKSEDNSCQNSPEFPLDVLKAVLTAMLKEAVLAVEKNIRDPVGGSIELLLVPLLQLLHTLLLMGVYCDSDLQCVLSLILPSAYMMYEDGENDIEGEEKPQRALDDQQTLLQMKLPEAVKVQLCHLLQYLCDSQLRNRIEAIVTFSADLVGLLQGNQRSRYMEVMDALNMSAALTARKTKEFRSPPQEQMNMLLNFRDKAHDCPCPEKITELLWDFHLDLRSHCGLESIEISDTGVDNENQPIRNRLRDLVDKMARIKRRMSGVFEEKVVVKPVSLQWLISDTVIRWAHEGPLEDPVLVRAAFALLHCQYAGLAGKMSAPLHKAYCITQNSVEDTLSLQEALGRIRSLLTARMGKEEEELMIQGLGDIMKNKVFYQHPNLMRALGMHETVMEVMVNVLGTRESKEIRFPKMVAHCCRFLCYFCRISRHNQKAMFDHLSYLLDHSSVGLASPSMRGSTPLDVVAASVMDNYELALALTEPDLEKVVQYLAGCGLQSCTLLLSKGYADIGWNPVEGERYLDLLRFAVFCNGESVEENAYVVVRLLIRRPECFGPALRVEEGNGLLATMEEAIKMSEEENGVCFLKAYQSSSTLNILDDDVDVIHMGHAIMTFYSALIDLLGRCAPEMHLIEAGKGEAIRIRAILRSLIPVKDLEGVISIPFPLPFLDKGTVQDFLQALYHLSKASSLTKAQHDAIQTCLLSVCGKLKPSLLQPLLRNLTVDVPQLSENTKMPLKVIVKSLLTDHYEQNWKYYCMAGGCGGFGSASEAELQLNRKLFWDVFRALMKKPYNAELFELSVGCLVAVSSAIPPDHVDHSCTSGLDTHSSLDSEGHFCPQPLDTSNVIVPNGLEHVVNKYAEHTHEKWSLQKDKENYRVAIKETVKSMLVLGWTIERSKEGDARDLHHLSRRISQSGQLSFEGTSMFSPKPADISSIMLTWDQYNMAEQLAENYHNLWAKKRLQELHAKGGGSRALLLPYDSLSNREKSRIRVRAQDILKFFCVNGFTVWRERKPIESDCPLVSGRFAYRLLQQALSCTEQTQEKMLELEVAQARGQTEKAEKMWHEQQMHVFIKVLLPLIDQYCKNHHCYFLPSVMFSLSTITHASHKEREMVSSLFCKLAALSRRRISLFGKDAQCVVSCLQILAGSLDAKVMITAECVRSAVHSFFEAAAVDLELIVNSVRRLQFRGDGEMLTYITTALIPVLTSLFQHTAHCQSSAELIVDAVQVSCYRILCSLYALGTSSNTYIERHRPVVGECLAALSAAFPVCFLEVSLDYMRNAHKEGISSTAEDSSRPLPSFQKALSEVEDMLEVESAARHALLSRVMEITVPMLCSYVCRWSEEDSQCSEGQHSLIPSHTNALLGQILSIIHVHMGRHECTWMKRIAAFVRPMVHNANAGLLMSHFLPLMEKLKKRAKSVLQEEEQMKLERCGDVAEMELVVQEKFAVLVQDIYAFYPILIPFVEHHRILWLREMNTDAERLFTLVAEVFIFWAKSHNFKWEEQNFVVQNDINNSSYLVDIMNSQRVCEEDRRKVKRSKDERYSTHTSLIVASLKKLLSVGLNQCCQKDRDLVTLAKNRFSEKDTEEEVRAFICIRLQQDFLHTSLDERRVERVLAVARVLFYLDQVESPQSYRKIWVEAEDDLYQEKLIEDLAKAGDRGSVVEEEKRSEGRAKEKKIDPLHQLISLFHQSAMTERRIEEDPLYMAYTDIMVKSCQAEDEYAHDKMKSFEEKELEKQRLLNQQARLHDRGTAEMVLQRLSASRGDKVMADEPLTCDLFRFLQLLCEGHNAELQNYLRSQTGNNTTVNIVISTVDYLLRLQESISDFYWYYSGKDVIDEHGQRNFSKAIRVAKQVFNTLTEYIQDSSQIELLKELMDLLKDMVVMLLSMLEGNVVNGTIGKQMVDMLVESSSNVEMILTFFDMFLKLKDLISSDAYKEYDPDGQGLISKKDFQKAMEGYKRYTPSERKFILSCVETTESKLLDYRAFMARFHEPAKDIGFNVAVLLTNLSEHMPHDARLRNFLELADSVLRYFQPHLGRIEIMGSGKRVERVYFEISESSRMQWEKPQVKESKHKFIFGIINEGGEKEKMELFVNFCEDTIFEMQLAAQISASDRDEEMIETEKDGVDKKKDEENKNPSIDNDGTKNVQKGYSLNMELMKQLLLTPFSCLMMIMCLLSIRSIKRQIKRMTVKSLVLVIAHFFQRTFSVVCHAILGTICFFLHVLYLVFLSGCIIEFAKETKLSDFFNDLSDPTLDDVTGLNEGVTHVVKGPTRSLSSHGELQAMTLDLSSVSRNPQLLTDIFGLQLRKEGGQYMLLSQDSNTSMSDVMDLSKNQVVVTEEDLEEEDEEKHSETEKAEGEDDEKKDKRKVAEAKRRSRRKSLHKAAETEVQDSLTWKMIDSQKTKLLNYFARNFYNMRVLALCVAFGINFILLFYKVPLVVFKREKELARKLEFDGLYVTRQPADDDIRGQWDRLAINTPSFPSNYWDKFVKRKVMAKYSELYGSERISELLGLDKTTLDFSYEVQSGKRAARELLNSIDIKYQIWKLGVVFTDNSFLYLTWYMLLSILGHYNNFFFAAHLLDVAMGFKTLRTILSSVTHNGKQLILTVGLLAVVVYLYTVVAFNFFRKFYNKTEDGQSLDMKCDDMLTCYMFHMYVGVRAGGGIGDEIEDPAGDDSEFYRVVFDITFFFFVIVILLAIIQGLIIDAFGELRDQQEQVKEDMETKCFICGIGSEYFDAVPHGFESHTLHEHNLANYLFFVQYLINKDVTEHTGQESYVWKMYQERCWEFFPVGDCFRKQYEDQLG
ncbi:ryanodine receptor 2 isoform X1 [Silurus asotus]|uniref:Ryanodine receptor 2 isoform X1 n=1 Tax=Silurus asotus TaxID=30991 RepID=A0AAD5ALI5_SILAS|nr:ryanodine receptor 2 isoform X1 [Silurus asotus]